MWTGRLIELISVAIPVININLEQQSAYMLSRDGSRIETGTDVFADYIKRNSCRKVSVDLVSDWELQWYFMRRDSKGVWWATSSRVREKLLVGTDEQVSCNRLCAVEDQFKHLAVQKE